MSYELRVSNHFKKEAKRLVKKYSSLKLELEGVFAQLEENPKIGTSLGNDVYKLRLAIASKNKGKSGGARIIYYIEVEKIVVLLLSIYNKGEKDNISDAEIIEILKENL